MTQSHLAQVAVLLHDPQAPEDRLMGSLSVTSQGWREMVGILAECSPASFPLTATLGAEGWGDTTARLGKRGGAKSRENSPLVLEITSNLKKTVQRLYWEAGEDAASGGSSGLRAEVAPEQSWEHSTGRDPLAHRVQFLPQNGWLIQKVHVDTLSGPSCMIQPSSP